MAGGGTVVGGSITVDQTLLELLGRRGAHPRDLGHLNGLLGTIALPLMHNRMPGQPEVAFRSPLDQQAILDAINRAMKDTSAKKCTFVSWDKVSTTLLECAFCTWEMRLDHRYCVQASDDYNIIAARLEDSLGRRMRQVMDIRHIGPVSDRIWDAYEAIFATYATLITCRNEADRLAIEPLVRLLPLCLPLGHNPNTPDTWYIVVAA